MNKHLASVYFAAALGWTGAIFGQYMVWELRDLSNQVFFEACRDDAGLFFVGTVLPGHMIQFNCYDRDPAKKGVLFSLPPQPDVGVQP